MGQGKSSCTLYGCASLMLLFDSGHLVLQAGTTPSFKQSLPLELYIGKDEQRDVISSVDLDWNPPIAVKTMER